MSSARLCCVLILALAGVSPGSHRAARAGDADEAHGVSLIESSQELQTCRETISLNGTWDFSYDPQNVGQQEAWFADGAELAEKTMVPGCDQANDHPSAGMSEEDYAEFHRKHGEFMMDVRYPTVAAAWHRKRFAIPAAWRGREVWLHIGGVNPAADIWLNEKKIGSTLTSRTPIRCDLTHLARLGGENTLVVRTHWPQGPRLDGLFNYVSGFSGLYRGVRVEAVPPTHIRQVHVVGQIDPPAATVHFAIGGATPNSKPLEAVCEITGLADQKKYSGHVTIPANANATEIHSVKIDMPGAQLWSPEAPNLHRTEVTLRDAGEKLDAAAVRFGLREIRCEGLRILLGGRPVFLRGGCDDHVYPATICPPASKEFYLARLAKAKRYGFNYTKSCMEIFTEELLEAADEVGMLVCQEMPTGLTGKYRTEIRQTMPEAYQELYRRETANIVRSDRNHPSIIIYSMVSEMGISHSGAYNLFCRELPELTRRLNPTALVIDVTHTGGKWTGSTSFGPRRTDMIEETAGNQFRQEPLSHPIAGRYEELDRPFIVHEYNWWTSLPEPSLAARYEGLPGKLNGVPELEAAAARAGFSDQLPTLVDRSRKLKRRLQKSGLELARRNPKISGYHFWLISGFSWCQEGVFNEFFDEPQDITAEQFRRFNDDTVLLLDDGNHRSFESGQTSSLGIQVSHFGPTPLVEPTLRWQLINGESEVAQGSASLDRIPCGTVTPSCATHLRMPPGPDPARLDLRASLLDGGRLICRNDWPIWVVPPVRGGDWTGRIATDLAFVAKAYPVGRLADPLDEEALKFRLVVTSKLGETLLDYLAGGGRVVLLSDGILKDYRLGPADLYRSVPWNAGADGNMGTVIRDHPALGKLPHEGWCDLNFVHLISGAFPILLDGYRPKRIRPIVRSIGHKNTMADKAYLFEVGVGKGAILATSLRFAETHDSHPEARYLLECLLRYAAGDSFVPEVTVSREEFASTLAK